MKPPVEHPKRIVFVCVENSNRSQIAEAFARLHGGGRVEAYSAGSRPSGKVNPRAVEFMREVGYDLTAHRSKGIADLPAVEFDAVVGMGCGDEGCPLVRARRREEWAVPDPKELPPEQYRAGARPDRGGGQTTAGGPVMNAPSPARSASEGFRSNPSLALRAGQILALRGRPA